MYLYPALTSRTVVVDVLTKTRMYIYVRTVIVRSIQSVHWVLQTA
jgi:hypothetical protein